MADIEVLRTRLANAEEQYHLLVTGQAAKVFVDQNGERVEYAHTRRQDLAAYIQQLKDQIAGTNGTGPMNVWL